MPSLVDSLDVGPDLVLRLVRNHPGLALLSSDNSSIIPINERDALLEKLSSLSASVVVSKTDFAAQNDLDLRSVDTLLSDLGEQLVNLDDYVYSKAYERDITEAIQMSLNQAIERKQ